MLLRRFTLESARYPDMLDAVKEFAKNSGYIFVEQAEENGFAVALYDRRRDSILANAGFFLGSFLASPGRIRFVIRGVRNGADNLETQITSDILLASWDIVDDRPKRMDLIRCERVSDWLMKSLEGF